MAVKTPKILLFSALSTNSVRKLLATAVWTLNSVFCFGCIVRVSFSSCSAFAVFSFWYLCHNLVNILVREPFVNVWVPSKLNYKLKNRLLRFDNFA